MGCQRTALPVHPPTDVHTCHIIWAERSREVYLPRPLVWPAKAKSRGRWTCHPACGVLNLYHEVYLLRRLPGPLPCEPEKMEDTIRNILSSLRSHLWRQGGTAMLEEGQNNCILEIFMFISSIISLISTILIIYLICKDKKIRMLIASLVLHQVKQVGTTSKETNPECRSLAYIGIILTILSLIIVMLLHYRKSRFCKGHRFSNAVKTIFIWDM